MKKLLILGLLVLGLSGCGVDSETLEECINGDETACKTVTTGTNKEEIDEIKEDLEEDIDKIIDEVSVERETKFHFSFENCTEVDTATLVVGCVEAETGLWSFDTSTESLRLELKDDYGNYNIFNLDSETKHHTKFSRLTNVASAGNTVYEDYEVVKIYKNRDVEIFNVRRHKKNYLTKWTYNQKTNLMSTDLEINEDTLETIVEFHHDTEDKRLFEITIITL